ncbi:beta-lactamase/transpeptidase-like protein [Podospora conica]|nr:beta-lactamase/transpeptidase-like protein [Schizothecium conicum]
MAFDRQRLVDRLSAIPPLVAQLCRISGTPGASIAIAQRGQQIYHHHYGYRDVETKEPPDDDTLYWIGSLSKGMAAAAVGVLVDEGKLNWSTPVQRILPEFRQREKSIEGMINIADILAHRTGITSPNALWSQGGNKIYLERADILPTFAYLQPIKDFRASFQYCNFAYWLADEIVHRVTDVSFGTFLTDRIFSPLGMTRTFVKPTDPVPQNSAKPYMAMRDGSFLEIPPPAGHDGSAIAAAGGVRSSLRDLLVYYSAILKSRAVEFGGSEGVDSESTIIKQASYLTSGQNFLASKLQFEQSYGFGLARVQLPGVFGALGLNSGLVPEMPVIGKGDTSKLVIYHQGSYPGFLTSIFMIPEHDIVIVVLTNSLAFNDAADWLGQLVLEYTLDTATKTDFVGLAERSRDATLKGYDDLEEHIKHDLQQAPARPLASYVGSYFNSPRTFAIRIIEDNGKLQMYFQKEDWDLYPLSSIGEDLFTWAIPYEEQARRARWPLSDGSFFRIQFQADGKGNVGHLQWHLDPNTGPETFVKESAT